VVRALGGFRKSERCGLGVRSTELEVFGECLEGRECGHRGWIVKRVLAVEKGIGG
jgi:hypothetical protein